MANRRFLWLGARKRTGRGPFLSVPFLSVPFLSVPFQSRLTAGACKVRGPVKEDKVIVVRPLRRAGLACLSGIARRRRPVSPRWVSV
ncbi:hypothetical protein LY76DRAFT_588826 [Colletotrichum caudatum]|nr:hypothetical protein LY76DRAFT_588826 [Colletotrichum caudatum]